MKFTKFGKALLMGALSAGVVFGISSCVVSYTVGFLYITGTTTAQPSGAGIINGYTIDHNTGQLASINGLPVASGGANPVRAVLLPGSRFLYVLNRGTSQNPAGPSICTTAYPCSGANITQFAVGGNGILTPQETFFTQGVNPFRLISDSGGTYLMVLDHDAPDNYVPTYNPTSNACTLALGTGVKTCGDVTVFQVQSTTGRLSLIENQQVTAAGGASITYFPVPANPVDFNLTANSLLTLTGSRTTPYPSYPYAGGTSVFPYTYNGSSGQLTLSLNSAQALGINQGTAMVSTSGAFYVLDNEPPNPNPTGATSQILPYTLGTNGALQPETSGIIPDDPTLSNPIYVMLESKSHFLYVANQGNNILGNNTASGISGYFITTSPAYQATFIAGQPFGSGAGPQCIVEDPSNQFVYTANFNDSTITGHTIDVNSGVLDNLRNTNNYSLPGPATWCLIDGRTS